MTAKRATVMTGYVQNLILRVIVERLLNIETTRHIDTVSFERRFNTLDAALIVTFKNGRSIPLIIDDGRMFYDGYDLNEIEDYIKSRPDFGHWQAYCMMVAG